MSCSNCKQCCPCCKGESEKSPEKPPEKSSGFHLELILVFFVLFFMVRVAQSENNQEPTFQPPNQPSRSIE